MSERQKISAEHTGQRLDIFVTQRLASISRAAIQKAIKNGLITINDKKISPHTFLKNGDEIFIPNLTPAPTHAAQPKPRPDIKLDIIFEDKDIIVINKPSGLLVHPTFMNERDSLTAALLAHAPEIAVVGEGPERPGIMHRLDKEASGLMVVAKTAAAYESLKKQFQNHEVEKFYQVLVHGQPPQDSGTIDLPIGRAAHERRMAARSSRHVLVGDRPAVTHYSVLQYLRNATLVRAQTETGRTHQIRAHFKAIGCPVAGDKLYGHKRDRLGVGRLFLHADTLGFIHPTNGEKLTFQAPLPPELQRIVEQLRFNDHHLD